MYDAKTQVPVHNPIERYSIGDRTPGFKASADGSLTISMQHESPGKGLEPNWLPAPSSRSAQYCLNTQYWPNGFLTGHTPITTQGDNS